MSNAILSVRNLNVAFVKGNKYAHVLHNFELDLYPGQCVGLVGESGSGKTIAGLSLLQLLPNAARVSPESSISYKGLSLLTLPEKRMRHIRGKSISMIFQDALSALNPVFTIGQQLDETLRFHLSLSRRAARIQSISLLESVGLKDPARVYRSYPHELSGGMRQRAMIAMAVSLAPDIIIADEPTTALDVTIQAQVLRLLKDLQVKKQSALLFIGHDLSVISQMADDVIVLQKGQTVEKKSSDLFFKNPQHDYSKNLLSATLTTTVRSEKKQKKPADPLLKVGNLSIEFKNNIKAVTDVSFQLALGETVALVGESGSGKTTVAKGILQLIKEARGSVEFEGQVLNQISKKSLRQLRGDMQFIFQDPASALNPRMLIIDSLSEGLLIQKQVKNRVAAENKVDELLAQVGLDLDMKWRYPHEFSGGQKQRLCIARALVLSPKLLILDEPTSALDVSIQKQILDLLIELQDKYQLSYLLITHNLGVVAYMADRVLVMRQGNIVESGEVNDILTQPQHDYTRTLLAAIPVL